MLCGDAVLGDASICLLVCEFYNFCALEDFFFFLSLFIRVVLFCFSHCSFDFPLRRCLYWISSALFSSFELLLSEMSEFRLFANLLIH